MTELEKLVDKVRRLTNDLNAAKEQRWQYILRTAPVHVGDVVLWQGEEYRVTRVLYCEHRITEWAEGELPSINGAPRKKDGEWSLLERNIHHPYELMNDKGER